MRYLDEFKMPDIKLPDVVPDFVVSFLNSGNAARALQDDSGAGNSASGAGNSDETLQEFLARKRSMPEAPPPDAGDDGMTTDTDAASNYSLVHF